MLIDPSTTLPPDSPAASVDRTRTLAAQDPFRAAATAAGQPAADRVDPVVTLGSVERGPAARARADPDRSDARLTVRVPTGIRRGDGRRPGDDAADGFDGPAVRRRPPGQLRGLRQPGAAARVRPERLRRDAPRTVGVGRQAPRGERRRRVARERLCRGRLSRYGPDRRLGVPHAGSGPYAGMRALEVWYAAIPIESIIERVERARDRAELDISMDEARRRDHMRALGKLSTKDARRRLAHPRPTAAPAATRRRRPGPGRRAGPVRRRTCGRWHPTGASSSRSTVSSTSPSRSSASAAWAHAATSPCSPVRPAVRSSSRSRRRASRSWHRTSAGVATVTRANGSSPDSGSCRPSRTASSAGPSRR